MKVPELVWRSAGKIINKHRGKIFATSSISEGTVIHILLAIA